MTRRDWFAGQALVGMLSALKPGQQVDASGIVKESFRFADAMIAEELKAEEQ